MKSIAQKSGRTGCHRALIALGVATLCLRALIPVGYMPGDLMAGEFMVLCPVGLPATLAEALHQGHNDHAKPVIDADRNCPIGSALQQAWLPTAPFSFAEESGSSAVDVVTAYRSRPAIIVYRYHSRAPPLT